MTVTLENLIRVFHSTAYCQSEVSSPQVNPVPESEPIPILRPAPPQMMDEEDSILGGHFSNGRGSYLPDNMNVYYSRFP